MLDADALRRNFGYRNGSVLRDCIHCGIPFYGAKDSIHCRTCANQFAAKAMAAALSKGATS
jgi:hypothetical protein